MNPFQHAFENLTQPQADVLTAATTLLSALIVAIFAPLMFHLLTSKGFKNFSDASEKLKDAADRVETQVETVSKRMSTVNDRVTDFTTRVADFGIALSSLQESVATTQNTLIDTQSANASVAPNGSATNDNRERVREIWRSIQELVERAAAKPTINGNTRAKYARWDRRNYLALVTCIHNDGHLPGNIALWEEAYWAWQGAIRSGLPVADTAVQRMEVLYGILSSPFAGGEPPKAPNAGTVPSQYTRPSLDRFNGEPRRSTAPPRSDNSDEPDAPAPA